MSANLAAGPTAMARPPRLAAVKSQAEPRAARRRAEAQGLAARAPRGRGSRD